MTTIRQLGQQFHSGNIKPALVTRTAEKLITSTYSSNQQFGQPRRELDRRCNRDRRQKQQPVLLDLRSPYSRRISGRRSSENGRARVGIDVYA